MSIVLDVVVSFILGGISYAGKRWIGEKFVIMTVLVFKFIAIKVLRLSKKEMQVYHDHRTAARQSGIARARK